MVRSRLALVVLGALGLTAASVPAASAMYAPQLAVSVDAARPAQTAKFSFVVTQGPRDPGSRRIFIAIPAGFRHSEPLSALTVCDWPQEMMRVCPDASRIGSVENLSVVPGGTLPLDGGMYWGGERTPGRYTLVVFLDNIGLNQHPQFEGSLSPRGGGGFDLAFDDLPEAPSQRFAVFFDGGKRAVLTTPTRCATYRFDGSFISRGEERASSSVDIPIRGCLVAPFAVSDVEIGDPRIRKGSRATVHFTLNRNASVRALVHDSKGRTVLDRKARFRRGKRVFVLGRGLPRGSFRIGLYFQATDGSYHEDKVAIRVR